MSRRSSTRPVDKINSRTIILPSGSKPSAGCAKDYTRPSLMHGYLFTHEGDRWLATTDAYIMVALKIQAGADVQDGLVPLRVLQLIEQRKRVEQVSPYSWRHVRRDDCEVTYDLSAQAEKFKQPDFAGLYDGLLFGWPTEPCTSDEFGVNAELVWRVQTALGASGLRFHVQAPLKPISVVSLDGADRRALVTPVRVLESARVAVAA